MYNNTICPASAFILATSSLSAVSTPLIARFLNNVVDKSSAINFLKLPLKAIVLVINPVTSPSVIPSILAISSLVLNASLEAIRALYSSPVIAIAVATFLLILPSALNNIPLNKLSLNLIASLFPFSPSTVGWTLGVISRGYFPFSSFGFLVFSTFSTLSTTFDNVSIAESA